MVPEENVDVRLELCWSCFKFLLIWTGVLDQYFYSIFIDSYRPCLVCEWFAKVWYSEQRIRIRSSWLLHRSLVKLRVIGVFSHTPTWEPKQTNRVFTSCQRTAMNSHPYESFLSLNTTNLINFLIRDLTGCFFHSISHLSLTYPGNIVPWISKPKICQNIIYWSGKHLRKLCWILLGGLFIFGFYFY